MKKDEELDQIRFLVDRFDRLLQMVDLKGNIIAVYHITIVGGLLLNYNDLREVFLAQGLDCSFFFWVIASTTLISLVSLTFIFLAIFPFLESINKKGKEANSFIFFGSIFKMGQGKFIKGFSDQSVEDVVKDFKDQAFNLAKALSLKFRLVRVAGLFCYGHLLVALAVIITKLFYL